MSALLPFFNQRAKNKIEFFCVRSNTDQRSPNGTLFTPRWPLDFTPDLKCSWLLNPPAAKVVRMFFMSLQLDEQDQGCDPSGSAFSGDEIRINGKSQFVVQFYFSIIIIIIIIIIITLDSINELVGVRADKILLDMHKAVILSTLNIARSFKGPMIIIDFLYHLSITLFY